MRNASRRQKKSPNGPEDSATIGFEDRAPVRKDLTAEQAVPAPHFAEAEYNSARPEGLLGLIFLTYISDTFRRDLRAKLSLN